MDHMLAMNGSPAQAAPTEWTGSAAGAYLLGHLVRFGQLLRRMGIKVSTSQVLDLIQALEYVSIRDQYDFYCTCRALMVSRREDFLVFDQAFAFFWRAENLDPYDGPLASGADLKRLRLPSRPLAGEADGDEEATGNGEAMGPGEGERRESRPRPLMIYSPNELVRRKDFGEMTWEEIQEARRAIASLEWRLGQRRTRRARASTKGRLNLRRIVRDNLRHGGEPVYLAFRQRVYHPRSLVVLCDISGSMERYSRMLLHFVHALTRGLTDTSVEAFTFGTRLTRITRHLRYKDVDEALDKLGDAVRDWSGGTRIGETLRAFNFQWARRVLGRGAVVLIISDGWDRGDLDQLAKEIARLQRSSYRLMWLNPLLGSEEYQPVQRGMAAALPFVDDFMPVHNLASLEDLARALSSVATLRPVRKQRVAGPQPSLPRPNGVPLADRPTPEWLRALPKAMGHDYGGLG